LALEAGGSVPRTRERPATSGLGRGAKGRGSGGPQPRSATFAGGLERDLSSRRGRVGGRAGCASGHRGGAGSGDVAGGRGIAGASGDRVVIRRWLWFAGAPTRIVILGLLNGYRRLVAPALGERCRFYPSCSTYAVNAVRVHGAVKGSLLATWRVLRCSPLSAGGPDPIPAAGTWRSRAEAKHREYDVVIREA
jgi:putative membrane protein insertion efficiency factor